MSTQISLTADQVAKILSQVYAFADDYGMLNVVSSDEDDGNSFRLTPSPTECGDDDIVCSMIGATYNGSTLVVDTNDGFKALTPLIVPSIVSLLEA